MPAVAIASELSIRNGRLPLATTHGTTTLFRCLVHRFTPFWVLFFCTVIFQSDVLCGYNAANFVVIFNGTASTSVSNFPPNKMYRVSLLEFGCVLRSEPSLHRGIGFVTVMLRTTGKLVFSKQNMLFSRSASTVLIIVGKSTVRLSMLLQTVYVTVYIGVNEIRIIITMSKAQAVCAHPRLNQTEEVRGHNVASIPIVATFPLKIGTGGRLTGSFHLAPTELARMCGQSDPDLAHIKDITVTGASTNVAAPFSVVWSHGLAEDPELSAPFTTIDRETHICGATNDITSAHAIIPAGCGTGLVTDYKMNTETRAAFSTSEEKRNAARWAVGRSLRWGGVGNTEADMAGSCVKVSAAGANNDRYLIPTATEHMNCAMSRLFGQNATSATFCDGQYSVDKRVTMPNMDGVNCTVVEGPHFDSVQAQLRQRLSTQTDAGRFGLSCSLESLGSTANDELIHKEMTAAGFAPTITLRANMKRIQTQELLSDEPSLEEPHLVETTAHFHQYLGEQNNEATVGEASQMPVTSGDFAAQVLAVSLGKTAVAPSVYAANATVQQCGADEE